MGMTSLRPGRSGRRIVLSLECSTWAQILRRWLRMTTRKSGVGRVSNARNPTMRLTPAVFPNHVRLVTAGRLNPIYSNTKFVINNRLASVKWRHEGPGQYPAANVASEKVED